MKLKEGFNLLATAPDGVARLRKLILRLAVQGKLAPQDPSDEPAGELVRRITSDPSTATRILIETGRALDKVLPLGWCEVPLGLLFTLEYGATLPQHSRIAGEIPVYGSNGVVGQHNLALVEIPSIIIGRKGSVGAVNVSEGPFWPIDTTYYVMPPDGMDLRFTYLLFKSLNLGKHDKSTAIPGINRKDVYQENVAVPPTVEQKRIVTKFDELMRLCDELENRGRLEAEQHARLTEMLFEALAASESAHALAENWARVAANFDLLLDRPEAVDALEKAIGQLAVRGLLVSQDPDEEPAGELLRQIGVEKDKLIAAGKLKRDKWLPPIQADDEPFSLPTGWAWARFQEVGEFGRGKSKHRPRNDPKLFNPGLYPLIQTGEVARADRVIQHFNAQYSEFGLAQSKLWPAGTLCITIAANIADSAILGFDACFPDSVVGLVPIADLVDPRYFLTFIETAKDDLTAFAPATAQKNINLEILNSVLIPVPPRQEMARIVARVEDLRQLCADLRARLTGRQICQTRLAEALVEQTAAAGQDAGGLELAA
jgi:type I restriction enzyme S subunit